VGGKSSVGESLGKAVAVIAGNEVGEAGWVGGMVNEASAWQASTRISNGTQINVRRMLAIIAVSMRRQYGAASPSSQANAPAPANPTRRPGKINANLSDRFPGRFLRPIPILLEEFMSPMFVPGPVDVSPDVLAAQTAPMLPHRGPEFETIFQRASENARQVFLTQVPVFIVTASGTGLQEAAVRNLAKRDVLSCVNGAFSKRWYDVALSNGKQADLLEVEWGQPLLPEMVAEALQEKPYELLTIAHNETSAGVQNPIREIAEAARSASPETLICVDAVSSLGGVRLEMDAWGLDMVLTSSQKCLALPPGLALAAVSDRAMEYARQVPQRGWYFDLIRMEEHRRKDSTPATPAMSLIYALDYKLERILEEGLEARFARHSALAERVQNWGERCGLRLFAAPGYRSLTVTTVASPEGFVLDNLNAFLMRRGMRIASGYGQLKGKTFRIAHMGDTLMEDIDALLFAMDEYLEGAAGRVAG